MTYWTSSCYDRRVSNNSTKMGKIRKARGEWTNPWWSSLVVTIRYELQSLQKIN